MPGILSPKSVKKVSLSSGKIGIVTARWNEEITGALQSGAIDFLLNAGVRKKQIVISEVPGSFELPLAAQRLARKKEIVGVICLGCLIKGDTPHFEFISQAVSQGIMTVGLAEEKPVIFGVLTTLTVKQAMDRAGGKLGNKGEEAAATLLNMI